MQVRHTIQEWEQLTGIRINNSKGFKDIRKEHKDIYANKYTEEQFRSAARNSHITIKTNKGLQFMGEFYKSWETNTIGS